MRKTKRGKKWGTRNKNKRKNLFYLTILTIATNRKSDGGGWKGPVEGLGLDEHSGDVRKWSLQGPSGLQKWWEISSEENLRKWIRRKKLYAMLIFLKNNFSLRFSRRCCGQNSQAAMAERAVVHCLPKVTILLSVLSCDLVAMATHEHGLFTTPQTLHVHFHYSSRQTY